jgi:hypothetical protein
MASAHTGEGDSANLRSGARSHPDHSCTAPDSSPASTMFSFTPSMATVTATHRILRIHVPPPPLPRIHTMSTCYLQGQRQTGDRPVGRRDGRDGSAVDGEEGEYTARGPKGRTVASSGRRGPRHVCDRDNVALWFICQ